MTIKTAEYTVSSARVEQCPAGELPEFAFIGRSNVGKSSLINMLTGQSHLAKTSATPGKTVLINHFLIKGQGAGSKGQGARSKEQGAGSKGQGAGSKEQENTESPSKSLVPKDAPSLAKKESWYLVDLPGYGYARRGMEQREQLRQMITGYILRREQMMNLFLLIDVRHAPQSIDLEFIDWLGENGIPFSIVFTKADKLSKGKLAAAVSNYLARLADSWEELPPHFVTSSETKQGREELLAYIDDILNM